MWFLWWSPVSSRHWWGSEEAREIGERKRLGPETFSLSFLSDSLFYFFLSPFLAGSFIPVHLVRPRRSDRLEIIKKWLLFRLLLFPDDAVVVILILFFTHIFIYPHNKYAQPHSQRHGPVGIIPLRIMKLIVLLKLVCWYFVFCFCFFVYCYCSFHFHFHGDSWWVSVRSHPSSSSLCSCCRILFLFWSQKKCSEFSCCSSRRRKRRI